MRFSRFTRSRSIRSRLQPLHSMPPEKPRRLGRGLDALISAVAQPTATPPSTATASDARDAGSRIEQIEVDRIRPNPFQPRQEFRQEEIAELAASLAASGILQPIALRPAADGRGYELIAGERRLRAATSLGWKTIPAIVRQVDDRGLLTLALIENLQRSNLNPIEEAEGYQRLIAEFGLTQQQVADAVGKDRSTVNNILRLLALPIPVRRLVASNRITVGHARPLLALTEERQMLSLANETIARGLSVRDVERRVSEIAPERRKPRSATGKSPSNAPDRGNAEARRIEDQLRAHLQTPVRITLDDVERGTIQIAFYSADDLERLLDLIIGARREIR
jgi:ParB family transcriptional regulator, chromosome partitioning protein